MAAARPACQHASPRGYCLIPLGAILAIEQVRRGPALLVGGVGYLAMLTLAVAAMTPAPDFGPWGRDFAFDLSRLGSRLAYAVGPFVPLNADAVRSAFAFPGKSGQRTGAEILEHECGQRSVALSQANLNIPCGLC